MTVGNWVGQRSTLDPRRQTQAQIRATSRRYVNRVNGQAVTVLLVCGRPGRSTSRGLLRRDRLQAPDGRRPRCRCRLRDRPPSSRWSTRKRTAIRATHHVRLERRETVAPEGDRLIFASEPVLYKLYVSREHARGRCADRRRPLREVPQAFL
ncbi:MAG: hypothetical protein WKF75_19380 [Singulisphaera sp.]